MKKILRALLSLLAVFGIATVAVACGEDKETPTQGQQETQEAELTKSLAANDEGVYTVAVENGTANITCTKSAGMEWSALAAPVANTAGMQSLRFMVSGTCQVLFKIQSEVGGKEVKLQVNSVPTGYEWDLSGAEEQAILAGANFQVLVFVLPGLAEGTGEVTISNFVLSVEEAMFNPINSGYTNINADVNNYDGVSSTFNINSLWAENDKGTYEFEYTAEGTVVKYTKKDTYNFAVSPIAGAFGKFPYITIVVTGTAGEKMLVKAETNPAKEQEYTFTGERQVVTLDLSELEESNRGSLTRVMLFAQPGVGSGSGQFTIHDIYFTTEYEAEAPKEDLTIYYDGFAKNLNLNLNWAGSDEGVYTIANAASPWEVNYTKAAGQNWANLYVDVKGQLGNFSTLTFGTEFAEGVQYIVKIQSADNTVAKEYKGVGTGACDGKTIDLSDLTVAQRDKLSKVLIFVDYENDKANNGSFKIHWFGLEGFLYRGVGSVDYVDGAASPDVNAIWSASNSSCYQLERPEGQPWKITYTKNADQAWEHVVSYVLGGKLGNFSKLTGGLLAPEGVVLKIKVEGDGVGKEMDYTGTGAYEGFEFDLSDLSVEQRNKIYKVIIFAAPGNDKDVTGSFEIHWMSFAGYANQEAPTIVYDGTATNSFDANRGWHSGDKGVFSVTTEATPWKITWNKAAGQAWSSLKVNLQGNFADFDKVHCGIELKEGMKIIVKLEGHGVAAEAQVVGDANVGPQMITIDQFAGLSAEQKNKITNIYIFIDYENNDANTGELEIHWFAFEKNAQ